jgi:D-serine deaminase-like pyridoxal phosphate-dependent protein
MIRMKVCDLDTPALLVDMVAMESNLTKMAKFFKAGKTKLRPHFKVHKTPALSLRQLKSGAIGITCAKLGEAEVLVSHGIKNILIANEIVGETKIKSLLELTPHAEIIVAVDSAKVVAEMAKLARNRRTEVNVVIDVDIGLKRCGVKPGRAAVDLARIVAHEDRLKLRGVMAYEGHLQWMRPGPDKEVLCKKAVHLLVDSKRLIEREGIPVEIVSAGGTGTYSLTGRHPGVTEIQAGSYLLMDTVYLQSAVDFEPTLSLLTTVVSKTEGERLVVDAGIKALSREEGMPLVKGIDKVQLKALHAEHGIVEMLDPSVALEVGDKIEIWVYYADGTINLHERMYGIRNGAVEEVLRIEGRGKSN